GNRQRASPAERGANAPETSPHIKYPRIAVIKGFGKVIWPAGNRYSRRNELSIWMSIQVCSRAIVELRKANTKVHCRADLVTEHANTNIFAGTKIGDRIRLPA